MHDKVKFRICDKQFPVVILHDLHMHIGHHFQATVMQYSVFFQDDFVVSTPRKQKLKEHDQLLKKFEYSKALDSVLRKVGLHKLCHMCCRC